MKVNRVKVEFVPERVLLVRISQSTYDKVKQEIYVHGKSLRQCSSIAFRLRTRRPQARAQVDVRRTALLTARGGEPREILTTRLQPQRVFPEPRPRPQQLQESLRGPLGKPQSEPLAEDANHPCICWACLHAQWSASPPRQ